MAPRADVSDERKSQILDAAVKVIAKRGFAEARMDDIVEEAGISKGLVYWYFKSKDAVLEALVRRLFQPEMGTIRELPRQPGTARDRLLRFADQSARQVAAIMRLVPITFEFYTMAFRNKPIRKVINEFFATYFENIKEVIDQGITAGEFRKTDPAQAAVTIGAVLEGALLLWMFDLRPVDLATQIRSGVETVVRGLESGGGS